MWPWEHLALGYLLYSLSARALGREPPSDGVVVVLAFATQLPDLVDKPLSWGLGWFPSGYAVGHSALVAVPVGLVVLLAVRRVDRPRLGTAFVVGYWSHLAADVATPLRSGGELGYDRVLWPLSEQTPYESDLGLGRGLLYLDRFVSGLWSVGPADLAFLLALPLATLVIWALDGMPGVGIATRAVHEVRRRVR